jgi:hypothetical protein
MVPLLPPHLDERICFNIHVGSSLVKHQDLQQQQQQWQQHMC